MLPNDTYQSLQYLSDGRLLPIRYNTGGEMFWPCSLGQRFISLYFVALCTQAVFKVFNNTCRHDTVAEKTNNKIAVTH